MDLLNNEESIINEAIIRSIAAIGFDKLTPIQEEAIPVLLEGKDIIGQAQTGTGKTAAFGIPLIQNIDDTDDSVQGLVLCPTRELAMQAADEIRKFSKFLHGVKVLPIYGGADISRQIKALRSKVSIVVGTPGRVMDHMRRHTLKLENLKMLVLDEADEMLNMGFREDIETILKDIPSEHQTALFSATMPPAILDITKTYLKPDAQIIKVAAKELTMPSIKQYYYEVNQHNKEEVAGRILDYYRPKRSLIFCNTKNMVDRLCEALKKKGYFAEGLHGDLSQNQRDKVMHAFRNGTTQILIATDVAARGIDVDDVEAVINFDIPQDIEYYVHRIGRTGRAGKKGRAFTLVVGKEIYRIREIERVCKTTMTKRDIPTAKDVTSSKAEKIFAEVLKVLQKEDLTKAMELINSKLEDSESDNSALEIAAAFLKMQMGEEPEEIVVEKFMPRSRDRYTRGGGGSYGRGRSGFGEGRRDSRGRSGDGRSRSGDGRSRGNGEGRSRGGYGEGRRSAIGDGEKRSPEYSVRSREGKAPYKDSKDAGAKRGYDRKKSDFKGNPNHNSSPRTEVKKNSEEQFAVRKKRTDEKRKIGKVIKEFNG